MADKTKPYAQQEDATPQVAEQQQQQQATFAPEYQVDQAPEQQQRPTRGYDVIQMLREILQQAKFEPVTLPISTEAKAAGEAYLAIRRTLDHVNTPRA